MPVELNKVFFFPSLLHFVAHFYSLGFYRVIFFALIPFGLVSIYLEVFWSRLKTGEG